MRHPARHRGLPQRSARWAPEVTKQPVLLLDQFHSLLLELGGVNHGTTSKYGYPNCSGRWRVVGPRLSRVSLPRSGGIPRCATVVRSRRSGSSTAPVEACSSGGRPAHLWRRCDATSRQCRPFSATSSCWSPSWGSSVIGGPRVPPLALRACPLRSRAARHARAASWRSRRGGPCPPRCRTRRFAATCKT